MKFSEGEGELFIPFLSCQLQPSSLDNLDEQEREAYPLFRWTDFLPSDSGSIHQSSTAKTVPFIRRVHRTYISLSVLVPFSHSPLTFSPFAHNLLSSVS